MYRLAVFATGLAIAALALPTVLEHHAHAELLQSAWCLSDGRDAPAAALFSWHCPACPALVAGLALMALSPFVNVLPRLRAPARDRASQS
jgi:hypothetical protein